MSANNAMVTDMALKHFRSNKLVDQHGGSLTGARAIFAGAPEPWVDLSTGINPHTYPQCGLPAKALSRLPEPGRVEELKRVAASYYGVPQSSSVVVSPGTQPLLPIIAGLAEPGQARILGPTYSEHARCAALAGHAVEDTDEIGDLEQADLAVAVNPDNPTGRMLARSDLIGLTTAMTANNGLLMIDEAFMDVAETSQSLAGDVDLGNIVVLRSAGKFFGLAGVRLSFAIAPPPIAEYLAAALGPWPISATALEHGLRALADVEWQSAMRQRLHSEARELRTLLAGSGLELAGGTGLFQFVHHHQAARLFGHLGRAGILVRRFPDRPNYLRIGLPGDDGEWMRLKATLADWAG